MPKKLYIQTFGCQMNEYDSTPMANVLLLNTCSIREEAQEKVFSQWGSGHGRGGCGRHRSGELRARQRAPAAVPRSR